MCAVASVRGGVRFFRAREPARSSASRGVAGDDAGRRKGGGNEGGSERRSRRRKQVLCLCDEQTSSSPLFTTRQIARFSVELVVEGTRATFRAMPRGMRQRVKPRKASGSSSACSTDDVSQSPAFVDQSLSTTTSGSSGKAKRHAKTSENLRSVPYVKKRLVKVLNATNGAEARRTGKATGKKSRAGKADVGFRSDGAGGDASAGKGKGKGANKGKAHEEAEARPKPAATKDAARLSVAPGKGKGKGKRMKRGKETAGKGTGKKQQQVTSGGVDATAKADEKPKRKRAKVQAHQKDPERCWALCKNGKPCLKRCSTVVPYCLMHQKTGDSATRVVDHPTKKDTVGKILVARFPLPRGYRFLYFGDRIANTRQAQKRDDRQIDFFLNDTHLYGCIDPLNHPGCTMQFAGCPGPSG